MSQSKYIVLEGKGMFIFPKHLNHADIARYIIAPHENVKDEVVSAGFRQVRVNEENEPTFHCYGESMTIKKKSREEIDSEIFRRMFSHY